jgi:hypothetical protein
MTDFRALCAELLQAWQFGDDIAGPMNRARAALDEPEGEGAELAMEHSAEDYIDELYRIAVAAQSVGMLPSDSAISLLTDGYGHDESEKRHCLAAARVALARWGRPAPAPKPIPVSERLPEDGDCVVITAYDGTSAIDEHYCYLAKSFRHCGQVQLAWDLKPTYCLKMDLPFTYWLPASTQFLPTTVDSGQPT